MCERTRYHDVEIVSRFWASVERVGGCWVWRGSTARGYGRFRPFPGDTWFAHRFAYLLEYGEPPRDLLVCHRCDNPPCVRPDHLFLGTALDNKADCVAKNRVARGVKTGKAKLTETEVVRIRELHSIGVHIKVIAEQFAISKSQVDYVVRRVCWSHVP